MASSLIDTPMYPIGLVLICSGLFSVTLSVYLLRTTMSPTHENSLTAYLLPGLPDMYNTLLGTTFFLMIIDPSSIRLLLWRNTPYCRYSKGYPLFWVFDYCQKTSMGVSFVSLLCSIALLCVRGVNKSTFTGVFTLIFSLLSLVTSGLVHYFLVIANRFEGSDEVEFVTKGAHEMVNREGIFFVVTINNNILIPCCMKTAY